jgi:hypothetical protein
MRGLIKRQLVLNQPKRHPSMFADAELRHLDAVVRYAVVQAEGGRYINLNPDYWRERIRNLADTYELVPAQRMRLKGILTLLDLAQDALAPSNYDRCK